MIEASSSARAVAFHARVVSPTDLQRIANIGSTVRRLQLLTKAFGSLSEVRRGLAYQFFSDPSEITMDLARSLLRDRSLNLIPKSVSRLIAVSAVARGSVLSKIVEKKLMFTADEQAAVREVLEGFSLCNSCTAEFAPALSVLGGPALESTALPVPPEIKTALEAAKSKFEAPAFQKQIREFRSLTAEFDGALKGLSQLLKFAEWTDRTKQVIESVKIRLGEINARLLELDGEFNSWRGIGLPELETLQIQTQTRIDDIAHYREKAANDAGIYAQSRYIREVVEAKLAAHAREQSSIEQARDAAEQAVESFKAEILKSLPDRYAEREVLSASPDPVAPSDLNRLSDDMESIAQTLEGLALSWPEVRAQMEQYIKTIQDLDLADASAAQIKEITSVINNIKALVNMISNKDNKSAAVVVFKVFDHEILASRLDMVQTALTSLIDYTLNQSEPHKAAFQNAETARQSLESLTFDKELAPQAAKDEINALLTDVSREIDRYRRSLGNIKKNSTALQAAFGLEPKPEIAPPPPPLPPPPKAPASGPVGAKTQFAMSAAGDGDRKGVTKEAFDALVEKFRESDQSVRTILLGSELLFKDDIQAIPLPLLHEVIDKMHLVFLALSPLAKEELRKRNHDWRGRLTEKLTALSRSTSMLDKDILAEMAIVIREIDAPPPRRPAPSSPPIVPPPPTTIATPRELFTAIMKFSGAPDEFKSNLLPLIENFAKGYPFGEGILAAVKKALANGSNLPLIVSAINTYLDPISAANAEAAKFQLEFIPEEVI